MNICKCKIVIYPITEKPTTVNMKELPPSSSVHVMNQNNPSLILAHESAFISFFQDTAHRPHTNRVCAYTWKQRLDEVLKPGRAVLSDNVQCRIHTSPQGGKLLCKNYKTWVTSGYQPTEVHNFLLLAFDHENFTDVKSWVLIPHISIFHAKLISRCSLGLYASLCNATKIKESSQLADDFEQINIHTFRWPGQWGELNCLYIYMMFHRRSHKHIRQPPHTQTLTLTHTHTQTINWQLLTPRLRPVWQTWFQATSVTEKEGAERTNAQ